MVVLLALVGLGAQQSGRAASHPRNGAIAYAHIGDISGRIQIYTTNAAGTHRHRLTSSRKLSSYSPSYSPSGKRIAFVRASEQSDLWTMNANGGHLRRLTWTKRIDETYPAWSLDGKQIAFAVVSPNGEARRAGVVGPAVGIWVVGTDGHGLRRITSGVDTNPSWSPDGSQIAFDRFDPDSVTDAIYVVPAAGGTPTRLSAPGGISDVRPAWSPDGSRILFASDRPDTFRLDLWVMNPDGSDVVRIANTDGVDEDNPAWSPDGRRIVYDGTSHTHGSASYQLYVSNANGAKRRVITHSCGDCTIINDEPSWQPLR